ncbi:MAG: hypothetical protein JEY99_12410 [Spirochaetales bacterium]|nr:hypothetical protein [Spirochaetales bacterium]
MRKTIVLLALTLVVFAGCGTIKNTLTEEKYSTVTIVIDMPEFGGMDAGCNAVDMQGTNRAVSNWLYLDDNGYVKKTLEMNGQNVRFSIGEELDVSCNVWVGPQEDNDYRFSQIKKIVVTKDTVVVFDGK